jgi:hypothetical protein
VFCVGEKVSIELMPFDEILSQGFYSYRVITHIIILSVLVEMSFRADQR